MFNDDNIAINQYFHSLDWSLTEDKQSTTKIIASITLKP